MRFHSILCDNKGIQRKTSDQPAFFRDLNLDQVVDAITVNKREYNLKPFFYTPLHNVKTILYRQEVMRDLENATLMAFIKDFAEKMSMVRRYLNMVEKLDYEYHKKGWFLETVLVYCDAVDELTDNLSQTDLNSRGLQAFLEYLKNYIHSPKFKSLKTGAQQVKAALRNIKYCVIIKSGKFSVQKYEGETDYTVDIEKVFEKFRQGAVKNYLVDIQKKTGMNHIEAKILEFVAQLFPEPFTTLDKFYSRHALFMDDTISTFDREVQFYVSYLEFITNIKSKSLPFCYPQLSTTNREESLRDAFDLALANTLFSTKKSVVCNSYSLQNPERIIVVSGPNQGGKTTFARMFGQLHYLAALGCPIPGKEARLFLPDQILTHFEREEDIHNLRGKLEDDLVRIHKIFTRATSNSIIILNEIFSSTTLEDALFLSKQIMSRIMKLNALCVWVTFIDELSRLSEKTISMVSTVDSQDPTIRTFKIVRKPADGLAYALSIAQKHGLTYKQIKERIL